MLLAIDMSSIPDLPISYLTIAAILFVVIGLCIGFARGFGAELLYLIKFVLMFGGALVAMYILEPIVVDAVAGMGVDMSSIPSVYVNIALYCVALIVLWIITSIIWFFLKRIFLRHKVGTVSRLLGMILGVVKAFVFVLLFVWLLQSLGGTFAEVQFFVDNASVDPIGKFLIENDWVTMLAEKLQEIAGSVG